MSTSVPHDPSGKPADPLSATAQDSVNFIPEPIREAYLARRRALYLELDQIEKMLDLPRKGK